MPKLSVTVPHTLSQDEAQQRIQTLLGDLKQEYAGQINDLREQWNGNRCDFSFKAMGFSTKGALVVTPNAAELTGNLPLAATPFKGKIEDTIRRRAEQLLA